MFGINNEVKKYRNDVINRKEEGLKKMIDNLPELFKQIKEDSGISGINFKFNVQRYKSGTVVIEIESDDFADRYEVLRNAWSSVKIGTGNGWFWEATNESDDFGFEKDHSKPCPEIGYTLEISYKCVYNDGGRNGFNIGKAYASEKTDWKWEYKSNKNG